MASQIPCDFCEDPQATFLVTFLPNGDTVGLCVASVAQWAETVAQAFGAPDAPPIDPTEDLFAVTVIPTGDADRLTLDGVAAFAETVTAALDAQAAEARPEPEPELEPRPRPRKAPRRTASGRRRPSGAEMLHPPDVTAPAPPGGAEGRQEAAVSDAEWESSARASEA